MVGSQYLIRSIISLKLGLGLSRNLCSDSSFSPHHQSPWKAFTSLSFFSLFVNVGRLRISEVPF